MIMKLRYRLVSAALGAFMLFTGTAVAASAATLPNQDFVIAEMEEIERSIPVGGAYSTESYNAVRNAEKKLRNMINDEKTYTDDEFNVALDEYRNAANNLKPSTAKREALWEAIEKLEKYIGDNSGAENYDDAKILYNNALPIAYYSDNQDEIDETVEQIGWILEGKRLYTPPEIICEYPTIETEPPEIICSYPTGDPAPTESETDWRDNPYDTGHCIVDPSSSFESIPPEITEPAESVSVVTEPSEAASTADIPEIDCTYMIEPTSVAKSDEDVRKQFADNGYDVDHIVYICDIPGRNGYSLYFAENTSIPTTENEIDVQLGDWTFHLPHPFAPYTLGLFAVSNGSQAEPLTEFPAPTDCPYPTYPLETDPMIKAPSASGAENKTVFELEALYGAYDGNHYNFFDIAPAIRNAGLGITVDYKYGDEAERILKPLLQKHAMLYCAGYEKLDEGLNVFKTGCYGMGQLYYKKLIGPYFFDVPSQQPGYDIGVYIAKGDELYTLEKAYSEGIITDEQLDKVMEFAPQYKMKKLSDLELEFLKNVVGEPSPIFGYSSDISVNLKKLGTRDNAEIYFNAYSEGLPYSYYEIIGNSLVTYHYPTVYGYYGLFVRQGEKFYTFDEARLKGLVSESDFYKYAKLTDGGINIRDINNNEISVLKYLKHEYILPSTYTYEELGWVDGYTLCLVSTSKSSKENIGHYTIVQNSGNFTNFSLLLVKEDEVFNVLTPSQAVKNGIRDEAIARVYLASGDTHFTVEKTMGFAIERSKLVARVGGRDLYYNHETPARTITITEGNMPDGMETICCTGLETAYFYNGTEAISLIKAFENREISYGVLWNAYREIKNYLGTFPNSVTLYTISRDNTSESKFKGLIDWFNRQYPESPCTEQNLTVGLFVQLTSGQYLVRAYRNDIPYPEVAEICTVGDYAFTTGIPTKPYIFDKDFTEGVPIDDAYRYGAISSKILDEAMKYIDHERKLYEPEKVAPAKKLSNTIKLKTAKASKLTVKAKTLKKKKVAIKNAITFTKNKGGAVTYKITKVLKNKKKFSAAKFTVSKKGTLTLAKKLKKGTYKLTVKVSAKAKNNYKKFSKSLTLTVKIK